MKSDIFIPKQEIPISEDNVWKWYLNIPQELEQTFLAPDEKAYFFEYYHEAGLLRAWRRPFFRHHFSRTFAQAARHLFSEKSSPRILDLGCGTGTQILFFSLFGADVIGIDRNDQVLRILEKRKAFYERKSGRTLNIATYHSNVFTFDYESIAPIDGIHSMFSAFSRMQSSKSLLDLLFKHINTVCCFAVLEGNNTSWESRLIPSRRRKGRLSPLQFEKEMQQRSFTIIKHTAGFAIPPIFWFLFPVSVLRPIDSLLGKSWVMAISHQVLAKKIT